MYMCIFDEYNCINGKYPISTGPYPAFLTSPDCRNIYLAYMLGIGGKNERDLKRMTTVINEKNIL